MATRKQALPAAPEKRAYLLRIELRDFKPAIWREVWVDPRTTLRKLHAIVQAAMGWEDAHLYGFAIPGRGRASRYWGVPAHQRFEPRQPDDFMGFGDRSKSDARTRLDQVLQATGDKLLYLYDYGDDWEHLITLKKLITTSEPLPLLVRATHGCPPEDCGGVGGFLHLAEVLNDPDDPEHEDMREFIDEIKGPGWQPGPLDPGDFDDLAAAVAGLQPRVRSVRGIG